MSKQINGKVAPYGKGKVTVIIPGHMNQAKILSIKRPYDIKDNP